MKIKRLIKGIGLVSILCGLIIMFVFFIDWIVNNYGIYPVVWLLSLVLIYASYFTGNPVFKG